MPCTPHRPRQDCSTGQAEAILGEDPSVAHLRGTIRGMRDRVPAGISEDWPVVQACNDTVVPTADECALIEGIAGGDHPAQDQHRCELVAGHRGPHHALAQIANHHETWLAWDDFGLREFRSHRGCPLEIPLAQQGMGTTLICMLFDGHEGPHPCGIGIDLWWWGTDDLAALVGAGHNASAGPADEVGGRLAGARRMQSVRRGGRADSELGALGQVDRTRDRAIFRQIADGLRAAVAAGLYGPDDALPSESVLIAHFGVARMTVRQALQVLREEGLVRTVPGRGVFVRARPEFGGRA